MKSSSRRILVGKKPVAPVSPASITTSIETITPELARQYLDQNFKNRPIKKNRVALYADNMRQGHWKLNGEGLIFSNTGRLQNGQHRLLAVIEADMPVSFLVIRGVEEDAFSTMDGGVVRTMGDLLHSRGVANFNQTAAVLRLATNYRDGSSFYRPRSNPELEKEYDKRQDIATLVSAFGRFTDKSRSTVATTVCIMGMMAGDNNQQMSIENFVDGVVTVIGLQAGDPRLLLRNKYETIYNAKSRPEPSAVWFYTAKALNMYLRGRTAKTLLIDRATAEGGQESLFMELPFAPRETIQRVW